MSEHERRSIRVARMLESSADSLPAVSTSIEIHASPTTPASVLTCELWVAAMEALDQLRETWPGPPVDYQTLESELATYGLAVPPEWFESGLLPGVPPPS